MAKRHDYTLDRATRKIATMVSNIAKLFEDGKLTEQEFFDKISIINADMTLIELMRGQDIARLTDIHYLTEKY